MNEPLIGRDREINQIRTAFDQREPCLIEGEAGIGKTALVRSATGRQPSDPGWCGGLESLAPDPFGPFERLLRMRPDPDPESLSRLVIAHATDGLVIEDLQWTGPLTHEIVRRLAGQVPLIVTTRTGTTIDGNWDRFERVTPAPLPPSESSALVARLRPDLDTDAIEDLVRQCGGNPGAIADLTATGRIDPRRASALAEPVAVLGRGARRLAAAMGLVGLVTEFDEPAAAELLDASVAVADGRGLRLRLELFGQAAEHSLDAPEQRALYQELAPQVDDPARGARFFALAGDHGAATALALRAAAEAPTPADRASLCELAVAGADDRERPFLLLAGSQAWAEAGAWREAADLASRGLAADAERTLGGALSVALSNGLIGTGDFDAARRLLEQDSQADATAMLGSLLAWPYLEIEPARRLAPGDAAVSMVSAILGRGSPDDVGSATLSSVIDQLLRGESGHVLQLLEDAVFSDRRYDIAVTQLVVVAIRSVVGGACRASADALGRWAADHVLERHRTPITALQAVALGDSGATGTALALLDDLPRADTAPPGHTALVAWARAEVDLIAGRPVRAFRAAESSRAAGGESFPTAPLCAVVGAWAAESPGVDVPEPPHSAHPITVPAIDEFVAVNALRAGRFDEAIAAFDAAADGWEGRVSRAELRCRWGAAESRRRRKDPAAVPQLEHVEQTAADLGHRALVARARSSLREAGVRQAPVRGVGRSGLTAREAQVLEEVARGLTSREVGHALGIAASTVDTIADSARIKLGARNRRHAALIYIERQG